MANRDPNGAIVERLDTLIQILLPSAAGYELPPDGDKFAVLARCDYEHTREQIGHEIRKSLARVDVVLNQLRNAGLIKSVSKDNKTFYVRVR